MVTFDTYAQAKAYFEEEKKIITKGKRTCFSYPGDPIPADESKCHDVMLCMFTSSLMYNLGDLKEQTMQLGYTFDTLKEELKRLFDDGTDKEDLARLMTGEFKLKQEQDTKKGDGGRMLVIPPEMNFTDIETLLLNKDAKFAQFNTDAFQAGIASEMKVVSFQSFKMSTVLLYRLQAKYNKDQLVYGIVVRCKDQFRDLILSFRGSSTVQDWLQNIQVPLVELSLRHDQGSNKAYLVEQGSYHAIEIHIKLYNKFKGVLSLAGDEGGGNVPLKIRVHAGMLGYLFSDNDGKSERTMYAKIRDDLVALCNYDGDGDGDIDKIYVTGHSLGGGLATLASFLLACDKSFSPKNKVDKQNLKCIAFADPCVGNVGFQRAMAVLSHYKKEDNGRNGLSWQYPDPSLKTKNTDDKTSPLLRPGHVNSHAFLKYTRFQNDRDAVPMLFPLPGYRNTGIKVHLRKTLWGSPGRHAFASRMFGLYPYGGYSIHRDSPVMDESATSFWNCFIHMAGPFFGLLLTTLPVVVLVLYTLVGSIIKFASSMMPCNADFATCSTSVLSPFVMDPKLNTTVFVTLACAVVVQIVMGLIRLSTGEANTGEKTLSQFLWGLQNQIGMLVMGLVLFFSPLVPQVSSFFLTRPDATVHFQYLVAMAVLLGMVSWYWFAKKPMTGFNPVRIFLLIVALPGLLEGLLYLTNDAMYALSIQYGAMGIGVGLLLLQIVMLVRAPWDVYSVRTHSLNDYYDNLRPHHPTLSRTKKILEKYIEEKKTK